MLRQDVLVCGVCSAADCARTIECWNALSGCEISVRAASRTRFLERNTKHRGELLSAPEERGGAVGPLHRWAVDSAANVELASRIECPKPMEGALYAG